MALGQNLGATLMTNTAFANSLNQIRSNLATAFTPIFNAIMPALNALMSTLSTITGYIAAFMSAIFGKSMSSTKAGPLLVFMPQKTQWALMDQQQTKHQKPLKKHVDP